MASSNIPINSQPPQKTKSGLAACTQDSMKPLTANVGASTREYPKTAFTLPIEQNTVVSREVTSVTTVGAQAKSHADRSKGKILIVNEIFDSIINGYQILAKNFLFIDMSEQEQHALMKQTLTNLCNFSEKGSDDRLYSSHISAQSLISLVAPKDNSMQVAIRDNEKVSSRGTDYPESVNTLRKRQIYQILYLLHTHVKAKKINFDSLSKHDSKIAMKIKNYIGHCDKSVIPLVDCTNIPKRKMLSIEFVQQRSAYPGQPTRPLSQNRLNAESRRATQNAIVLPMETKLHNDARIFVSVFKEKLNLCSSMVPNTNWNYLSENQKIKLLNLIMSNLFEYAENKDRINNRSCDLVMVGKLICNAIFSSGDLIVMTQFDIQIEEAGVEKLISLDSEGYPLSVPSTYRNLVSWIILTLSKTIMLNPCSDLTKFNRPGAIVKLQSVFSVVGSFLEPRFGKQWQTEYFPDDVLRIIHSCYQLLASIARLAIVGFPALPSRRFIAANDNIHLQLRENGSLIPSNDNIIILLTYYTTKLVAERTHALSTELDHTQDNLALLNEAAAFVGCDPWKKDLGSFTFNTESNKKVFKEACPAVKNSGLRRHFNANLKIIRRKANELNLSSCELKSIEAIQRQFQILQTVFCKTSALGMDFKKVMAGSCQIAFNFAFATFIKCIIPEGQSPEADGVLLNLATLHLSETNTLLYEKGNKASQRMNQYYGVLVDTFGCEIGANKDNQVPNDCFTKDPKDCFTKDPKDSVPEHIMCTTDIEKLRYQAEFCRTYNMTVIKKIEVDKCKPENIKVSFMDICTYAESRERNDFDISLPFFLKYLITDILENF